MNSFEAKLAATPSASHWKTIGMKPHYGIAIPLFSIHTKNSSGLGEFFDLIPLIDWCSELGLDVIQILPINDCGSDPSPYNAISSCAINPIYLSLTHLPYLDKFHVLKDKIPALQVLTKSPRVAYHEVKIQKTAWLRDYFTHAASIILKTQHFMHFIAENAWVEPYALFKVLKDLTEQYNWATWPREYKSPTRKEYQTLVKDNFSEISFYIFLQYLCFRQLSEVKKYANERSVLLKGDIPILISPDSADVWHEPELFDTSVAAGAPPDSYNPDGQYWGFPLYNWDLMGESNFEWWRRRLKAATPLYNLYRVDHIIGFFRIWAIPHERSPKEGYFVPRDEILWLAHGERLLQMMLHSSPMLPIGEDLGWVIPIVRKTLESLGICGTRVLRWERRWEKDRSFIPLEQYSPLTMTTVSTHDSETLSLWWRDSALEAKEFAAYKKWPYTSELTAAMRKEILWESHHTPSLFHINLLNEYLALFPEMVWPRIEDERINIPGKMLPANWTYRLRLNLEEMTAHPALKAAIKEILHAPLPPKVQG